MVTCRWVLSSLFSPGSLMCDHFTLYWHSIFNTVDIIHRSHAVALNSGLVLLHKRRMHLNIKYKCYLEIPCPIYLASIPPCSSLCQHSTYLFKTENKIWLIVLFIAGLFSYLKLMLYTVDDRISFRSWFDKNIKSGLDFVNSKIR